MTFVTNSELKTSWNWIVGPRYDLTFFIGSAVAAYLLIVAHFAFAVPALVIWWWWIVFFDGPHLFATWIRTYFDVEEWRRRGAFLLVTLLLFFVPALAIILDNVFQTVLVFAIVGTFLFGYQWWHILRQHYGFLVIYQRKNQQLSGRKNGWDYWSFHALMIVPFVAYVFMLPPGQGLPQLADLTQHSAEVIGVARILCGLGFLIYAIHLASEKPMNGPKILLFLSAVSVPFLILFTPALGHAPYQLVSAAVTIGHNVQYHAIIWHYSQNRYHAQSQAQSTYGIAPKLTRTLWQYYLAVFALAASFHYGVWFLLGQEKIPFVRGGFLLPELRLGLMHNTSDLLWGLVMSLNLHHYVLDQFIWKVSKDERLQHDLALQADSLESLANCR